MNLKMNDTVYFKFNDEICEGIVDEVTETKITMHCPPKHHGYVYTARLFEFEPNEYGTKFAATKEELL